MPQGFEAKVDFDDLVLVEAVEATVVVAQRSLDADAGVGEEGLTVRGEDLEKLERLACGSEV